AYELVAVLGEVIDRPRLPSRREVVEVALVRLVLECELEVAGQDPALAGGEADRLLLRARGVEAPAEAGHAVPLEGRRIEGDDTLTIHSRRQGPQRRLDDLLGGVARLRRAGVDRMRDLVYRAAAHRVVCAVQDHQPPRILELALRPGEPRHERRERLRVPLEERLGLRPLLLLRDPGRDDAGQQVCARRRAELTATDR